MPISLASIGGFDITPWSDRVQLVDAERWSVGASGTRAGRCSTAVLIHPRRMSPGWAT